MAETAYQPSVQSEALPGRPNPRLPEGVSPQEQGAAIGQGVENAGQSLQNLQDRLDQQANRTAVTGATTTLDTQINQKLYDPKDGLLFKQGADAFNLAPTYLPQLDQQAKSIAASLSNEKQRDPFMSYYMQRLNETGKQLNTHEAQQTRDYQDTVDKASVASNLQTASMANGDPQIIARVKQTIADVTTNSMERNGIHDPEVLAQGVKHSELALHMSVLEGLLTAKNPDGAKTYLDSVKDEIPPQQLGQLDKAIKNGQTDQAIQPVVAAFNQSTSQGEAALAALAKRTDLDQDQKAAATKEIENQRNGLIYQKAQQYDKQLTTLHSQIASGQAPPDAVSRANYLYEKGAMSQGTHIAMLDSIQASQKKADDTDGRLGFAQAAFDNGTKLDPKDKNQTEPIDLLFEQMTATSGFKPGSDGYTNTAASIANKTGVIPSPIVGYARATIMGGPPQDAARAAQMLDRLRENNQQAYGYAVNDKQLNAAAHTISSAVSAGTDPETAVTMARDNANLSESERQALNGAWGKANNFTAGTNRADSSFQQLRSQLSNDPKYEGTGFPFFKPGVPKDQDNQNVKLAAGSEYEDLTHEYFLHTGGNIQQARQLAANDMKQTWGVSEVNGKRELMKYAPERMFPGLTPEMIHADIAASYPHVVAENAGKQVQLVESPSDTAASGGKIWNLGIRDQFGALDIARDAQGNRLRYQLPDVRPAQQKLQEDTHIADRARLEGTQRTLENERNVDPTTSTAGVSIM